MTTPTLSSLLTTAEDLSASLLRARNAATNTPEHAALARIERAMLSVYAELVALEQADVARRTPGGLLDADGGLPSYGRCSADECSKSFGHERPHAPDPLPRVLSAPTYYCCGVACPGYPFRASERPHPDSCRAGGFHSSEDGLVHP